jgi:hypothetical protein
LLETKSDSPSDIHRRRKETSRTYHQLRDQQARLVAGIRINRQLRRIYGPESAPVIRSIWWVHALAIDFEAALSKVERSLPHGAVAELRAPLDRLPLPTLCKCGCGYGVTPGARGRLPRYALPACRKRAHRRRRAGVPEFAPRLTPGGRLPLARRLEGWLNSRDGRASLLLQEIRFLRESLRSRYGLSSLELRRLLKYWRQELSAEITYLQERRQDLSDGRTGSASVPLDSTSTVNETSGLTEDGLC